MTRSRLATIALGVGAVVCAAAALAWWASADRLEFYTGAGVDNASAAEYQARDILWRPPETLGEPLLGETDSFEPSVPAGGPTANNELLFARVSADGDTDLYAAERVGRVWSAPRPIAALNTLHNEQSPRLSPEGAWLYFSSDRPGGEGGLDLWRAPRTSAGWGTAENLGPAINTRANDAQPAIDPSTSDLWFASDRPRPVEDTLDDPQDHNPDTGFDLYRAHGERTELVAALSSIEDDVAPAFSPVGDFVYFSSARDGGAGGLDLYRARLSAGVPGDARSLGPPVNTDGDELDPAPASEGFELFYTSIADAEAPAVFRRTVSREVELARDVQYGDLGALLRLLPWILLVLAIVLLLSLLRRLAAGGAAGASLGALSLMAKCVLVSLVLHAILLALLALWMVEPEAGQLADADSGTRVSLTSSSIRSSLEAQVRDSAGDPVAVTAEDIADRTAPSPVDAVAATPESAAPAPTQLVSENPHTRAVAQTDAAAASSSPSAPPTLSPEAVTAADFPLDTPVAAAARRVSEAETRIDQALEAPRSASADLATSARDALASDSATPQPAQRDGDELPIERSVREATVAASSDTAGSAPAPAPQTTAPALAIGTPATARARSVNEAETRLALRGVETPSLSITPSPSQSDSLPAPTPEPASAGEAPRMARTRLSDSASAPAASTRLSTEAPRAQPSLALPTPGATDAARAEEADVRFAVETLDERPLEAAPTQAINLPAPLPDSARTGDTPRMTRPAPAELNTSPRTTIAQSLSPAAATLSALAIPAPTTDDAPASADEATLELALDSYNDRRVENAPVASVMTPASPPLPEPSATLRDQRRRSAPIAAPSPGAAQRAALALPGALATTPDLRLPIATPIPAEPEPDTLSGSVIDAVSGAPIAGARVRLDLAETDDASATSNDEGAFVLRAFDIPDNSAISASADGYIPYSANITADELGAGATAVILLWPESRLTVALEDDPEVHHLGNDAFTGRVNSQFQRRAEGLTIEMPFALAEEQLPPNTRSATLLMLAKGVQLENRFYLNGRRLNVTFPESPRDGSFGEVVIELPIRHFREGFNTLGVESVRRGDTDYDDFEFVNVRIEFIPAHAVID